MPPYNSQYNPNANQMPPYYGPYPQPSMMAPSQVNSPLPSNNPSQSMQGQPIQKLEKVIEPQAFCYFTESSEELKSVKVMPDSYYVGINKKDKEIYIRSMLEDGTTTTEIYKLTSDSQEKSELQSIDERLTHIEKVLSQLPKQREILTMKGGKQNESSNG